MYLCLCTVLFQFSASSPPPPPSLFNGTTVWCRTLHLFISVCTQFHHLFLVVLTVGFPVKYLTFLLLSIPLTQPIQFNRLILTNESMSTPPHSCINFLLYSFLKFLFTLIPSNILVKTFLSKESSHLAISLFSVQDSAL